MINIRPASKDQLLYSKNNNIPSYCKILSIHHARFINENSGRKRNFTPLNLERLLKLKDDKDFGIHIKNSLNLNSQNIPKGNIKFAKDIKVGEQRFIKSRQKLEAIKDQEIERRKCTRHDIIVYDRALGYNRKGFAFEHKTLLIKNEFQNKRKLKELPLDLVLFVPVEVKNRLLKASNSEVKLWFWSTLYQEATNEDLAKLIGCNISYVSTLKTKLVNRFLAMRVYEGRHVKFKLHDRMQWHNNAIRTLYLNNNLENRRPNLIQVQKLDPNLNLESKPRPPTTPYRIKDLKKGGGFFEAFHREAIRITEYRKRITMRPKEIEISEEVELFEKSVIKKEKAIDPLSEDSPTPTFLEMIAGIDALDE